MNRSEHSEKRRGFTLVELMVVVSLIGILTAIGFVSMLHYRTIIRVNASARDMAGQVRLARAKAIREGMSVKVQFTGMNQYITGVDADEREGFDTSFPKTHYLQPGIRYGFFPSINQIPGHQWPVACSVDINNCGTSEVHFRHDGTASYSGAIYLIPQNDLSETGNRDDRMRAVDWEKTTGRIRVWKWQAAAKTWR